MASTEQLEQNRADFYALVRELQDLVSDCLHPTEAKRAMEIVMEMKNDPRFMLLTIVRETIPTDLSTLFDEGSEEENE